jgi:DNA polymerase III delta' subunit
MSAHFPWQESSLRALLARRERFPHALLLAGPAGIGKSVYAQALAQGLLCESPRDGLACGACPACNWFSQGNHPDFRQVVPAAVEEDEAPEPAEGTRETDKKSLVIKVGQVREVADFMSLSTHRAGFRVLVLRPAEAMQAAAANALLKTLEEPPPTTAIVLVSDRPTRLLPTIRSRCQKLTLGMPSREAALAWLRAEGVEGAEEALALARENAEACALTGRVRFLSSDWFAGVPAGETFALVVANPPYLSDEETAAAQPEVKDFEPHMALSAGTNGAADLERIIRAARPYLAPGGLLACETGIAQHQALMALASTVGYTRVESLGDLTGRERYLLALG